MSRTRYLAAAVAIAGLVLGGCGSDDPDDDASSSTTAEDSAAESGDGGDDAATDDAADDEVDDQAADDTSDADGDDAAGDDDAGSDDAGTDDGDEGDEGDDAGSGDGAGEGRASSAGIDPCTALDIDEVGEAFGLDLTEAGELTGERTVQGVSWTTIACTWSSEAGDDVTAAVAGPDEFAEGFTCAEPVGVLDDPTPIDGLGDQAWWTWDDFQGGKGDLAACAGELRVDVTVEGPREGPLLDEDQVREGSVAIAEALLA